MENLFRVEIFFYISHLSGHLLTIQISKLSFLTKWVAFFFFLSFFIYLFYLFIYLFIFFVIDLWNRLSDQKQQLYKKF